MAKKAINFVEPSEFELQILGALWEHGSGTVRQVMERLSDGKERAYTSVLSVMQVMQKKGLIDVSDEREGLAHVFRPLLSREQVAVPLLRGLVRKIFGGSPRTALQHLLDSDAVDRDEIAAMRKLLDEHEKRKKK